LVGEDLMAIDLAADSVARGGAAIGLGIGHDAPRPESSLTPYSGRKSDNRTDKSLCRRHNRFLVRGRAGEFMPK
jgi:hypothetical protein